MSIVRAPRPTEKYYVLDKRISEDTRLSWAARGLLVYLLGKPDRWEVSVAALVTETAKSGRPTRRDGVYSLIRELESAGYLERRQARSDSGTFDRNDYIVSEQPAQPEPCAGGPLTAQPLAVKPTQVNNDLEQGLKDHQVLKEDTRTIAAKPTMAPGTQTDREKTQHDYPPEFEATWRAYPKRTGGNPKRAAFKAWRARRREGVPADALHAGVVRYAAYVDATGKAGSEYVKQARTFFGPDEHYRESWNVHQQPVSGGQVGTAVAGDW